MRDFFRQDTVLWAVAAFAVGLTAVVGSFNVRRMVRSEQELTDVRAVQTELAGLMSDMKDAETGHRGYVITGQDEYLKPFHEADRSVWPRVDRLRLMLRANPDQLRRLDDAEAVVREKFAEMRRVLTVRDAAGPGGGRDAAAAEVGKNAGKRLMDAIRERVAEMEAAADRQLDARAAAAARQYGTAEVVNLVGAAVAVTVLTVAALVVRAELRRRVSALDSMAAARADAEAALKNLAESEGRFRNLAEAMPQIVWMTRPDGYHEYYNAVWYQYTGMTPEQSIGWGWSDPLHPDDRERSKARWAAATAAGDPYEIEYRFRRADGAYRWFLGRANPVRDEAGAVVRWLGTCTDIDDQVTAARRLQESESYLRSVLDNSPDCVKVLDTAGRLLDMNGPGQATMGIDDLAPLRGREWAELWPDDGRGRVREAVAAAAAGTATRFSGWCPTGRGDRRFWDVIVAPIPGADGKPFQVVGVSRDVTEQKRAIDDLADARRFSESVLHSLAGHLAVIDADGTIVAVNESWAAFGAANGMPPGTEWVGRNYFAACADSRGGGEAARGVRAVAAGDLASFELEYPCHAPGEERFFLLRVVRFRGDGPVRLVLTHENVTARVKAERSVREAASQLLQLTEGLPLMIWACRRDGECDYLSRQWADYTGRELAGQYGYLWLDTLHPDDRDPTFAAWRRAVERSEVYDVEFRLRRHDGAFRWFAVRGIPLRDEGGRVARWYGACADIDDRKRYADVLEHLVTERTAELTRANGELVHTSALLRASNQELEKFAYIASHDLQEPLRKIQAFGDRLSARHRDTLGDQGRDHLGRILDSAGRMRRLIDDLLAFSRVSTRAVAHEPVDFAAAVRDVLADLEDQVARTGGRVDVGPLPTLPGDVVQLRQVFQNLIGNALKFARDGVPPLVTVGAVRFAEVPDGADPPRPPAAGWRVTVADNGIGFEAQYGERIFELFQRLHGRTQYEGTGLGLAIVRKILTRHGAAVVARSTPGEGTRFVIDWPTPATD